MGVSWLAGVTLRIDPVQKGQGGGRYAATLRPAQPNSEHQSTRTILIQINPRGARCQAAQR
jgi:hypothetical protein